MTNSLLTIDLSEAYLGRLLTLTPVEWSRWHQASAPDGAKTSVDAQIPGPFQVRVRYFLTLHGWNAWCGLVGVIEEAGHPFDCLWIGCSVNYRGYAGFTDRLRLSLCRIGPGRPRDAALITPSDYPYFEGAGVLAENATLIQRACREEALDS